MASTDPIDGGNSAIADATVSDNPGGVSFPAGIEPLRSLVEIGASQSPQPQIASLFLDPAEAVALSREMVIAHRLQRNLLPQENQALPGIQLAAHWRSAGALSGDLYDILHLTPNAVLLILADVMGKGTPAALFAATFRALVRTLADASTEPDELLRQLNQLLVEDLESTGMFITAQIVRVDIAQRQLTVASAGHCPLLLVDASGAIKEFPAKSVPLGIQPEISGAGESIPFSSFSGALMYSDGVVEAQNALGKQFGSPRLKACLGASLTLPSARQIRDYIVAQLEDFSGESALSDDQAFLAITQTT